MNYKKISTDFQKRFGKPPENTVFIGKPITFFKSSGQIIGSCVSAGCAVSVNPRDDGRIMIQFSDSDRFLSCNVLDLRAGENHFFSTLAKAKNLGIQPKGAEILFSYNTELIQSDIPLLLSVADDFCDNISNDLIRHFSGFMQNTICLNSKKDTALLFDGQNMRYLPFSTDSVKIVLCCIGGEISIQSMVSDNTLHEASQALECQDFKAFGKLLNKQTENAKGHGLRKSAQLFDIALKQGNALGSGFLEDGGIFSIVENKRVDTFMHDLSNEYKHFFGKLPDFYVTETESSESIKNS